LFAPLGADAARSAPWRGTPEIPSHDRTRRGAARHAAAPPGWRTSGRRNRPAFARLPARPAFALPRARPRTPRATGSRRGPRQTSLRATVRAPS